MPSIIKWNPFHEREEHFDDLSIAPFNANKVGWDLAVDIFEDEDNVVAEMSVPGIDPKKIDVSVENWRLTISGSREEKSEKKGKLFHKKEIRSGHFERRLSLPVEVDPLKSTAECREGLLKVTMAKKSSKEITKHKIKVG